MKRRPDEKPETDEAVAVPVAIAPAGDLEV
jgi:hypothetical protein